MSAQTAVAEQLRPAEEQYRPGAASAKVGERAGLPFEGRANEPPKAGYAKFGRHERSAVQDIRIKEGVCE
ncbi:hypothetical protein ACFVX6_22420 [Streptomyces sp. NPDC058289]|uniref:hypothetical protein n=1 Tax=Streptomyces sp. NPDC058289 TaxID=3346425 RepID=UPI0036E486D2